MSNSTDNEIYRVMSNVHRRGNREFNAVVASAQAWEGAFGAASALGKAKRILERAPLDSEQYADALDAYIEARKEADVTYATLMKTVKEPLK